MIRSSNPTLSGNPFSTFSRYGVASTMTMSGTVIKSGILLLLTLLSAGFVWTLFFQSGRQVDAISGYMMVGVFGGLIASLVTVFKKEWAPYSAPIYALLEGFFLGGISAVFESSYPGIVIQTMSMTFATLFAMLFAYQSGIIKATEPFKRGIIAATGGIALIYFVAIMLSLFGVNVSFIYGNSLFSILFSLVVVGIAAFNFVIDFDFIEQGAMHGAPKYMEWYGAFALMVTLVWLYIEILRLLSKINSRR